MDVISSRPLGFIRSHVATSFLLIAALTGCSTLSAQKPSLPPQMGVDEIPTSSAENLSVGLALAGGGSKAVPFAMGVLAGLRETGVLQKVDAISSVSGGSYAALYYFEQLLETKPEERDLTFADCIPLARRQSLSCLGEDDSICIGKLKYWSLGDRAGYCPWYESTDKRVPPWWTPEGTYWQPYDAQWREDPLRWASNLRGRQDVFKKDFSYRATTEGKGSVTWLLTKLVAINSIGLGIPNFATNILFDWRLDLSPSKDTYNNGIVTAWGSEPQSPSEEGGTSEWKRPAPDSNATAALTFDVLREKYHDRECAADPACRVPFWIINTTAGTLKGPLRLFDRTKFTGRDNDFEFTPDGYGSAKFGREQWHTKELEPKLTVAEAVGASSAFLDSQQRSKGGAFFGPVANFFLRLANLAWGSDIPNYALRKAERDRLVATHLLLPYPFYLFHHRTGKPDGLSIHLSDGGQSENLGVYALLRRGVKQIIVVDEAEDADYRMDDLRSLHNQLQAAPVKRSIFIQGLKNFPGDCGKSGNPFGLKDHWPAPILLGSVCRGDVPCDADLTAARLFITSRHSTARHARVRRCPCRNWLIRLGRMSHWTDARGRAMQIDHSIRIRAKSSDSCGTTETRTCFLSTLRSG